MLVWETLTRQCPFGDQASHSTVALGLLQTLLEDKTTIASTEVPAVPLPLPALLPPEITALLQACWHPVPAERVRRAVFDRVADVLGAAARHEVDCAAVEAQAATLLRRMYKDHGHPIITTATATGVAVDATAGAMSVPANVALDGTSEPSFPGAVESRTVDADTRRADNTSSTNQTSPAEPSAAWHSLAAAPWIVPRDALTLGTRLGADGHWSDTWLAQLTGHPGTVAVRQVHAVRTDDAYVTALARELNAWQYDTRTHRHRRMLTDTNTDTDTDTDTATDTDTPSLPAFLSKSPGACRPYTHTVGVAMPTCCRCWAWSFSSTPPFGL